MTELNLLTKPAKKDVFDPIYGENCSECPNCNEKSLQYDRNIRANRCENESCSWMDKIAPAPDMSITELEYCLLHAKPGRPKEVIQGILDKTKELRKKCEKYV